MPWFVRVVITGLLLAFVTQVQAAVRVQVAPDHETALYEMGQAASFTVRVTEDGKAISAGSLTYLLDNFLDTLKPATSVSLVDGEAVVKVESSKPQFVRCVVTYKPEEGKPIVAVSSVGFAVERIKPGLPVPVDFDQFWTAQKQLLAAVRMEARLTPVEQKATGPESFDLQVTCAGGAPVSGYFSRPRNAKKKSCPAILWVHGAGVRSSSLGNSLVGAREGMLSLDINAHGLPNGKAGQFYSDQARGPLANYRHAGRESRDTIYFRGMYLRIVRAIDFLVAQPQWDGRNVIVIGHSQGGGQSLVAGGIDSRVTTIAVGVPAICDHGGRESGQINGWPKIVPYDGKGQADRKSLQASRYIDAVNFASRCKAQAIMSVGFVDGVCPPSSCYAAYNLLQGEKQVINEPAMGHAAPTHIKEAFLKFIKASLK